MEVSEQQIQSNNNNCSSSKLPFVAPTENPDASRCCFYLHHKRRFCKTEKRSGSRYCHTHHAEARDGLVVAASSFSSSPVSPTDPTTLNLTTGDSANKKTKSDVRIPCPINPNHSIYERDVARHIRVCPDQRFDTTTLPYFSRNCHALRGASNWACASVSSSSKVGDDDVVEVSGLGHADDEDAVDGQRTKNKNKNAAATKTIEHSNDVVDEDGTTDAVNSKLVLGRRILSYYESWIEPFIRAHHSELVQSSASDRTTQKHSSQHVALCDLMMDAMRKEAAAGNSLNRKNSSEGRVVLRHYMELGAGKGGLAYAMLERLGQPEREGEAAPADMFVVVDSAGFRRKRDGCVRNSTVPFVRLRINIKDLCLAKVAALQHRPSSGVEPIVSDSAHENGTTSAAQGPFTVMGKHLCGACTDFALSCVTNDVGTGFAAQVIVIATCCHHLCELRHLNPFPGSVLSTSSLSETREVNPSSSSPSSPSSSQITVVVPPLCRSSASTTYTNLLHLDPVEFNATVKMTSWAVSGNVTEEKRRIGVACKRVIDTLRVHYLRSLPNCVDVELVQYVPDVVTKENVCLVARFNK